jgi:hypothetical protein
MNSETNVQLVIMKHFMYRKKRYQAMVPNFYGAYGWEADLLGITRYGYLHEFEIKNSYGDLVREFDSKAVKHANLKDSYLDGRDSDRKHATPKRFYFVVNGFWYNVRDLPSYCGLIHVAGNHVRILRTAPDLNSQPITTAQMTKIIVSFSHRWIRLMEKENK